jgi:hypothetical protein
MRPGGGAGGEGGGTVVGVKQLPWRQLIAGAAGGAAGYVYYVLVGCDSS